MDGDNAYLDARILIVDDEESNVILLERMLARAGYSHLSRVTDSREALTRFREVQADLVLLDLMMPYVDGYTIMEQIAQELPPEAFMPVLVLTADVSPQALERALTAGAKDFLTKPFNQNELLLRVKNLLETRYLYLGLQHQVQALEGLYEDAQAAIRTRDENLSSISHDFGQPLTALQLTTSALQQDVAAGELQTGSVAEDIDRVIAATSQLAAMLRELSDLALLQMGRQLVLQYRQTDLVALVRDEVKLQQRTTKRHRLRFEFAPSRLDAEFDPVRLRRVVSNLLDNAIKYSPAGGPVFVSLAIDEDGVNARLEVRDEGLGIPAEDLDHVFERFHRGRNVVNLISGTGIGLAGVRQIIAQHGGRIGVESQEGHGTCVTVFIPLTHEAAQTS